MSGYIMDSVRAASTVVTGVQSYLGSGANSNCGHREDKLFLTLDPVSSVFALAMTGASQDPSTKLERHVHLMKSLSADEASSVYAAAHLAQANIRKQRGDSSKDLAYYEWAIPHVVRLFPIDSQDVKRDLAMATLWKYTAEGVNFLYRESYGNNEEAKGILKKLRSFIPNTDEYNAAAAALVAAQKKQPQQAQKPQLSQRILSLITRLKDEILNPESYVNESKTDGSAHASDSTAAAAAPSLKQKKKKKTEDSEPSAESDSALALLPAPSSSSLAAVSTGSPIISRARPIQQQPGSAEDISFIEDFTRLVDIICIEQAMPKWLHRPSDIIREIWTTREFEDRVKNLDTINAHRQEGLGKMEQKKTAIRALKDLLDANGDNYAKRMEKELTSFRDS